MLLVQSFSKYVQGINEKQETHRLYKNVNYLAFQIKSILRGKLQHSTLGYL